MADSSKRFCFHRKNLFQLSLLCLLLLSLSALHVLKVNPEASAASANTTVSGLPLMLSPVMVFGSYGQGDGQFNAPHSITVVPDRSRIYIADTNDNGTYGGNNRVQIFQGNGSFIEKFGCWGSTLPCYGSNTTDYNFMYPKDVGLGSDRRIYVVDSWNCMVKIYYPNISYNTSIGSTYACNNSFGFFTQPGGIALDDYGNIYVADTQNHRIQAFKAEDNSLINVFGNYDWSPHNDTGYLNSPERVAVDRFGKIYVADTDNNRIQVFHANMTFDFAFGGNGTGEGSMSIPGGVTVDSAGRIYVADTDNSRIQVFHPNGTYNFTLGRPGSGLGEFDHPKDVDVDSQGRIYVADYGNHRIQAFDYVVSYNPELYVLPSDIVLNNTNPVELDQLKISALVRNVGRSSAVGFTVSFYDGSNGIGSVNVSNLAANSAVNVSVLWTAVAGNRSIKIVVDSNNTVNEVNELNNLVVKVFYISPLRADIVFGVFGSYDGQFNNASSIAVDKNGSRIFVADTGNNRIQVFNSTGWFLQQITGLDNPRDVALDLYGRIYVTDTSNNAIKIYYPNGSYESEFGDFGAGDGQFNNPYSVALDNNGNIYVADTINSRIQVFYPNKTLKLKFSVLRFPTDIALNPRGIIHILETYDHMVESYYSNGTYIGRVGANSSGPGSDLGEFNDPRGVALDAGFRLYVADSKNNRTQIFDRNGNFNFTFSDDGRLNRPRGVAVDDSGNIYVMDSGNSKVKIFHLHYARDTYPPEVVLQTQDKSNFTSSSIILNYSAADWSSVRNCSLYADVYGSWSLIAYDSEVGDAVPRYFNLTGVADGLYLWNVKCYDSYGNAGFAESNYTFRVNTTDLTPPVILNSIPENNTVFEPYTLLFNLSLSTDESASCRYANHSGVSYVNMSDSFPQKNTTQHSKIINGLEDNRTYFFYVKCNDSRGNYNTLDYLLAYRVSVADIVLNEFMPGNTGWVELYNKGETPVNLSGWVLKHANPESNHTLTSSVNSTGFLVLNSSMTGLILNETQDTITLQDFNDRVYDNFSYSVGQDIGGTIYNNSMAGYSIGRATDGELNWTIFNSSSASPGAPNHPLAASLIQMAEGWNLIALSTQA